MEPVTTALLLLLTVYIGAWVYIRKNPAARERGIVPYGPTIMVKTQAGKAVMERLSAPKRFWRGFAALSKVIVFGLMAFMTGLLLWQSTIIATIPREAALGPEYILGIPGLNPIIPIGYGVIALVVCIVIHEVAHGILTRVHGMNIKTTGLLFLVFPIGAFVEPDEEALSKATKRERGDVYAVGAAANFIVAAALALLLTVGMLGGVQASYGDNPVIVDVSGGSPADISDIGTGMVVVGMGGVQIDSISDFFSYNASDPGDEITVNMVKDDRQFDIDMVSGVMIESAPSNRPAAQAGLEAGMLIKSIDGETIRGMDDFNRVMDGTEVGQNISMLMLERTDGEWQQAGPFEITLTDGPEDKGYIGVTSSFAGMGVNTPDAILGFLKDPYGGSEGINGYVMDTLRYLALPFIGLSPMPAELTWLFPTGGALDGDLFWVLANIVYWVFWMNLMIGLTNSLPAVPLDGGLMFMDAVDSAVEKLKPNADDEERARIVVTLTMWMSLLILFLIIWQFVGPRI